MTSALLGHSGFVGETLLRQTRFDDLYRSSNIASIRGRHYDLVVCAAAPAAKWKANQEPEADRANLAVLMEHLSSVEAQRLVLVSTVDVYPVPVGVDEESAIEPDPRNAYGTNRLALERFCRDRFRTSVVRLPALFGRGLRKNAIYDLIHDNQVEKLQPRSVFQFYDMSMLWADLQLVLASGLEVVNVATEPLVLGEIATKVFGRVLSGPPGGAAARYDFRTRHAALWGRTDGYAYGAADTLKRIEAFVSAERAK